jgi:hypothetical protein
MECFFQLALPQLFQYYEMLPAWLFLPVKQRQTILP